VLAAVVGVGRENAPKGAIKISAASVPGPCYPQVKIHQIWV
jgi:hypothetical protein